MCDDIAVTRLRIRDREDVHNCIPPSRSDSIMLLVSRVTQKALLSSFCTDAKELLILESTFCSLK